MLMLLNPNHLLFLSLAGPSQGTWWVGLRHTQKVEGRDSRSPVSLASAVKHR